MSFFRDEKKSKALLFLSGFLLLLGFLTLLPQSAGASQFSAGWYQDGGLVADASCPYGYWRAYADIKDSSGGYINATTTTVTVSWYSSTNPVGKGLYSTTTSNSSTILTGCIDAVIKDSSGNLVQENGTMILTFDVSKAGYHTMRSSNVTIKGGLSISQVRWSRALYLVPVTFDPNIAYVFPTDNKWLNASTVAMKLFVSKRPASNNITKVKIEALNLDTQATFSLALSPNIATGTVTFPGQFFPDGTYTWRVKEMQDDQGYFYNEASYDQFRIDTTAPIFISSYGYCWYLEKGGVMVPACYLHIWAKDLDNDPFHNVQTSGISKVEYYIDGALNSSTTYSTSRQEIDDYSPPVYGLSVGQHSYYVIFYDLAGNKKKSETGTFEVPTLKPSFFAINSKIGNTFLNGAFMTLNSGPPQMGNTITAYNYSTTSNYSFSITAPASFNGQLFSFWYGCSPVPGNRTTSIIPVNVGTISSCSAYFGTSILNVYRVIMYGDSVSYSISSDLKDQIYKTRTDIEQTGGSPSGLGENSAIYYYRYIVGEIKDAVLKAYNSADGVLAFYGWGNCDTLLSPTECKKSVSYNYDYLYHYYVVQRTINIKSYVDGISEPGVIINNISGRIPGGTTDYVFKSTTTLANLDSIITAPLTYTVAGKEKRFDHWEGCDIISGPSGKDCSITGNGWYSTINRTIIAHYGSPPAQPTGTPTKRGEVKILTSKGFFALSLHDPNDLNLYFIKKGITASGPLRILDQNNNIKVFDLLPPNDPLYAPYISPIRIKTPYYATGVSDGVWALRKWTF